MQIVKICLVSWLICSGMTWAQLSLENGAWSTTWDEAVAQAQLEQTPILLLFAGSDWCRPCMRWEQELFSQSEFASWTSGKYVLYRADFPRKKKNQLPENQQLVNAQLAKRYNAEGRFPWCLILSPEGDVKASTAYLNGGLAAFKSWSERSMP